MEQLRASTTERVGRLAERVSGAVEDVTGTAVLGVSIFLKAGVIGQVLEPGAEAALNLTEQLVNRYLPATEEETRRLVSSPRGMEQILESERTYAGRLQRLISTSARRVYWSAWSYAEGLWRLMRRVLSQLLEFAVVLRRQLHRALVALTEMGDSDPGPRPSFPQDPISVRRAQGRRSSLGSASSKAASDERAVKNSVQDGRDDRFTSSPARRRLPATLNPDSPAKKSLSPPPLAIQLQEGRDRSRLDRSVEPGHHPFSATVE
ncbi:perilipin-2-like [Emydura macquarii macquarii]|uniref:perilipin-2-like n=1 Tax=Emydura macquarii macquarii TaxID=1129001 RepID=UPI00352A4144